VNFVADECCDAVLVAALRRDGHDVLYVREFGPGSDDDVVLQLSATQQRVLLTEDKDFGELVVRFKLPAFAVVLLRIDPADTNTKLTRLREVLAQDASRIAGSIAVIDESKTRFRPLAGP
jgi:predicted nuclease of predicted toxin-antitoxin system